MKPTEQLVRETWGQAVRRRRTALGLTQEALAERAHTSQPSVSMIERGLYPAMNPEICLRLALALDCRVIDICSWPHAIEELARERVPA